MNCAGNPFGVWKHFIHRGEDGLVAVAVDHQILHFPNSGFTEGRQKRNPTSVAFTLAEFKANGLNGVVAVHEGAEEDLPTIRTMATINVQGVNSVSEVVYCSFQYVWVCFETLVGWEAIGVTIPVLCLCDGANSVPDGCTCTREGEG